jgi:hypothetical protein
MKKKTSPFTWGIAISLLVGVVFFVGLSVSLKCEDRHPFRSQMALSIEQIRKVVDAVADYEKSNQRRPVNLEALVKADLLSMGDLFDPKRSPDSDFNPDVLYFPALRKTDPADLVLLCTIVTRKRGEPLLAVMNDYSTVELSPKELRAALQRTYSYLGGQIARNFSE